MGRVHLPKRILMYSILRPTSQFRFGGSNCDFIRGRAYNVGVLRFVGVLSTLAYHDRPRLPRFVTIQTKTVCFVSALIYELFG